MKSCWFFFSFQVYNNHPQMMRKYWWGWLDLWFISEEFFLKSKISNNNFIKYPPIPFRKKIAGRGFQFNVKVISICVKSVERRGCKGKENSIPRIIAFWIFLYRGSKIYFSPEVCQILSQTTNGDANYKILW